MRGPEPDGKNQSTDGGSVGDAPRTCGLNGEPLQSADGDGCHGTVKDRPADDYEDHFDYEADGFSEEEEAALNCGMGPDGQCDQAGSEYCDLQCPYRD